MASTEGPRRGGRLRSLGAALIVVSSILGALATWRASVAAVGAGEFDRESSQQLLFRTQVTTDTESEVAQDYRLFARYQQQVMLWRLLQKQANEVRRQDPELADSLVADSQAQLALARATRLLFTLNVPGFGNKQGRVGYDPRYVIDLNIQADHELAGLRPDEIARQGAEGHEKTLRLVGIAVLFAASLFFLSLSQLIRPRPARGVFLVTGGATVVAATVLFIVAELG